jgi:hypothetical protein
VFDAAAHTGRGLFSDYYLRDRLREDPAWRESPSELFAFVRDALRDAQARWAGKGKQTLRNQLLEPLFKKLGFKPTVNRPSKTDQTQPDYLLNAGDGGKLTATFIYTWDRWLDGPDLSDTGTPEANPGACVVTALDQGGADWIIVTNGRLWRLYSRQAHARSTNFYEVDLVEAFRPSDDTDPNEAFRHWSLFFRPDAFKPTADGGCCWLDGILQGSREYAKRLGERLKDRIFLTIFPHLAKGFLADRKQRLGVNKEPTAEELADVFEATLTLLYRLLFLLYAESRDLLPIREAPVSLMKIKEEIKDKAGVADSGVAECLQEAYSPKETALYDRLGQVFRAIDKGDPILNVPAYNGGLFNTSPDGSDRRDQRTARFLLEHKVPDRYLALAIDRLARDEDERTLALVFIDYKSLEVRHLGSIYEGLLRFKLKVADEDLTTHAGKKGETYIPLSHAKVKRGRPAEVVVGKKEVYLSNEKAERRASGSYYTPDPIVKYIVANTVGRVLAEKLAALRPEFRRIRKTFDNELQNSMAHPSKAVKGGKMGHRQWAGLQTYLHHQDLVEGLFDLRVLDPAMGSGHFLVETADFVTNELLKFLNQFPINPVNIALDRIRNSILESLGEQGVTVDRSKLTDINLLKRHVLKRCIYGVDLSPLAVELAKVSLWLDAFALGAPLNFLDHHLRSGNSLIGATFMGLETATATLCALNYEPRLRAFNHVLSVSKVEALAQRQDLRFFHWQTEFPEVFFGFSDDGHPQIMHRNRVIEGSAGFDCVVGNPPYGGDIRADVKKCLVRLLPQMLSNPDTAVGFIELASNLASRKGRIGLIVPKPLTYSYAWRGVREFLDHRILNLVDVSRAWKEVLLEQVIVVYGRKSNAQSYRSSRSSESLVLPHRAMPWALAERFKSLPCALEAQEIRWLRSLKLAKAFVGDIYKTFRGLPAQGKMRDQGTIPVIGGRDLERWRVRSCSGFLSDEQQSFDLSQFQREKLVFQNIIAHVSKPNPHIVLIGAHDSDYTVTLDTVNNLIATHSKANLHGLLGLLHSRFINWFVYSVIYNKAIRTMHFDQYFLDKIPLPEDFEELLGQLAPLAARCCRAAERIATLTQSMVETLRETTNIGLSMRDAAKLVVHPAEAAERLGAKNHRLSPGVRRQAARVIAEWHHRLTGPLREKAEAISELDVVVDRAYGSPLEDGRLPSISSTINSASGGKIATSRLVDPGGPIPRRG